jgi:hypothetical protein
MIRFTSSFSHELILDILFRLMARLFLFTSVIIVCSSSLSIGFSLFFLLKFILSLSINISSKGMFITISSILNQASLSAFSIAREIFSQIDSTFKNSPSIISWLFCLFSQYQAKSTSPFFILIIHTLIL